MAKNSAGCEEEIALGAGAVSASLIGTGVIAEGGAVATMLSQAACSAGFGSIFSMGSGMATGAAGLLAAGPVGWVAVGIGGAALIAHSIYRAS